VDHGRDGIARMSASRACGAGAPALKRALHEGALTVGSWLTFRDEAPAELMARAGFEWLVLDMEHAPLGVAEAARLIRVIELAGVPALCRLPANDPVVAKQVLDAGASGLLVPCVNSALEARRAVEAAFYPPRGRRGVGLARAQAYGQGLEAYRTGLEDRLLVIAMVETREGVEAAAEIAATPGVDGLFIGPYDLSASLGVIGRLDHPRVREAEAVVRKAARAAGVACGMHLVHPSASAGARMVRDGYTMIAVGVDMIVLGQGAAAAARLLGAATSRRRMHERVGA
jgi:2-dehydro-3-deoxyglucarate aldolase